VLGAQGNVPTLKRVTGNGMSVLEDKYHAYLVDVSYFMRQIYKWGLSEGVQWHVEDIMLA
jgi:hypothetical protein